MTAKTVMCFGTFDILHLGHLQYFQQAKQFGDRLVVVIARDKTKERQKKVSVFSEQERLELVKSLEIVDDAVLGYHNNHLSIIQEIKPDILCLGYDHNVNESVLLENLQKRGLNPIVKRMKPYQINKHKSSRIKEIMLRS